MTLAFISSPRFVDHVSATPGHPERPDRIRAIHVALRQAGLLRSPSPYPEFGLELGLKQEGSELLELTVEAPADDEVLRWAHPAHHIDRIRQLSAGRGGFADEGETWVGPESDTVARLAVAAATLACDVVMEGRANRAFAAVRPPGHHAESNRAMGFCLYANAALAALHLQHRHSLPRVAVVDFDVHHGNGTQAIFEDDPTVLNISLHESPETLWPATGYAEEVGFGPGRGTTLNVPLPAGTGDEEYLRVMEAKVLPALRNFGPGAIVACAGFDAHAEDPLAHLNLSEAGFARIGRLLCDAADELCGGRLVATLEGGYNLRALGRSAVAFLRELAR